MDDAAVTVCCKVLINCLLTSSVIASCTFGDVTTLPVYITDVTQALNHTELTVPVTKQEMMYVDRSECW